MQASILDIASLHFTLMIGVVRENCIIGLDINFEQCEYALDTDDIISKIFI